MNKKEKLQSLVDDTKRKIEAGEIDKSEDVDIVDIDKYVIVDSYNRFFKCGNVSTNHGKDYKGFKKIQVANPHIDENKLAQADDIYGADRIYNCFIESMMINGQQKARKLAEDGKPKFDFDTAFDMFSGDDGFIEAHKAKKSREYLKNKWDEHFTETDNDEPKWF